MQRLTISIDDDLAERFEALVRDRGYANRSEAFRDLLRKELVHDAKAHGVVKSCVACLSYVFDHHQRQLGERLLEAQHEHHDLVVSTMHVHLDHENCLESVVLRGPVKAVEAFAASIISEKGVRHGQLNLVAVANLRPSAHRHTHSKPHT